MGRNLFEDGQTRFLRNPLEQIKMRTMRNWKQKNAADQTTSNKNIFWCYLAIVLVNPSLISIKHDCLDRNGIGDGQKGPNFSQQRLKNDETVTVVSVMRQLAKLQFRYSQRLNNYSICARELLKKLVHAGGALSNPICNAMILNGLPEQFKHFVVQEILNTAGFFTELRMRLISLKEARSYWECIHDSPAAMAIKKQIKVNEWQQKSTLEIMSNEFISKIGLQCFCFAERSHFWRDCRNKNETLCNKV